MVSTHREWGQPLRQAGQLLQHQAVVPILSRRVWLPLGRQRLPWHLSAAQHVVDGIFWVRAVLFRLNEHALSMSPPSWCKCMHWARIRALDICIGFDDFRLPSIHLGRPTPTFASQPATPSHSLCVGCVLAHAHGVTATSGALARPLRGSAQRAFSL